MKNYYFSRIYTSIYIFLFILSSCATPYQPKDRKGGYTSKRVNENTYIVSFYGNQHINAEIVRQFLFYYSAELTTVKGYSYYYVYEDQSYANEEIFDADISLNMLSFSRQSE